MFSARADILKAVTRFSITIDGLPTDPTVPMTSFHIALAQINPVVGDIPGNTRLVLQNIAAAKAQGARAILFPELVLTGYPPEDLLLRPSLEQRIAAALQQVAVAEPDMYVVVGYPALCNGQLFNARACFLLEKNWRSITSNVCQIIGYLMRSVIFPQVIRPAYLTWMACQ
jgi:predicted amidohydrolase